MRGIVTNILSICSLVDTEEGLLKCAVRSRLVESDTGEKKPVAVGDEVEVELTSKGEGVVTGVYPRRTKLSRSIPRDRRIEHVILIDRYIIAAETGGLQPAICLNKVDLATDASEHREVAEMYGRLGYPVLLTSAVTGAGLDGLKAVLKGKSTALAGHSGVGKSSLLNAVQPGLKLKTALVDERGRHCTSTVSLLKLDVGGYVVDTPGVREFSLWDIARRDVAEFYPDIWERSRDCRMPDCIHVHENDCAVKAAVERGEVPRLRYESYIGLLESVVELEVPRYTDVDQPNRQLPQTKRRPSRHTHKQQLEKRLGEEMGEK